MSIEPISAQQYNCAPCTQKTARKNSVVANYANNTLAPDTFTPSFQGNPVEDNKKAGNMLAGAGLLLAGAGLAWWLFPQNAVKVIR